MTGEEEEIQAVFQILQSEDKKVREHEMVHLIRNLNKTLTKIEGHLAPARLFYPRQDDPGIDMSVPHDKKEIRFGIIVNTLTVMPTPVNIIIYFEEEWERGRQQWRQYQRIEAGEGTTIRNIEVTRMFLTNTDVLAGTRLRVYATGNKYTRDD